MNSSKELRQQIGRCEILHSAFVEIFDYLKKRVEDAEDQFPARIEWIVGPSRVGKSMLIKSLASLYPETISNGKRQIPVLVVPIQPNISPVLLPSSVLGALGIRLPERGVTNGVRFGRMIEQLRLAQTKVLIFEEASHLVEPGARVIPRAAGDWFKSLSDSLNITIFFFGVPRLERLIDSNEQLKWRASPKKVFLPYYSLSESEYKQFAACVRTYADLFSKFGWPIELDFQYFVSHCYLLSGGLIGVLSHFMQELAREIEYQKPRGINLEDCRTASVNVCATGHPDYPAFRCNDASPATLALAHAQVLDANGLPARRLVSKATQ